MKRTLPESLCEAIESVAHEAGVQIYDIEYTHARLQVFVESEQGVTVETCTRVSELLSQKLDASNLILGRYVLEVSSPGLERKLRGFEDFRRHQGRLIHVVTSHGVADGIIQNVTDNALVLCVTDREQCGMRNAECGMSNSELASVTIPLSDIKRANLKVSDSELFSRPRKAMSDSTCSPAPSAEC